ncbi:MAG TPA: hypothetical protein VES67_21345 [Vicinamibacterales bacterium]|nr:hypothetical protein [Vicinamibacterales bacterium]
MSEIDPADVAAGGNAEIPEEFAEDLETGAGSSRLKTPVREGLPPNYKMRADAHYVDQLSTRRAERQAAARTADVAASEPPVDLRERRDARERRADKAFAQLAEDVVSIESAAAVLASDVSPMTRRANVDVIVAQAWRASWLLRAMAILDSSHRGYHRPRQLGFILTEVCERLSAESRLSGFALTVHASDWNASVSVDEGALVTGLTGAVFGTLGVVGRSEGVTVRLSASASAGELRTVEVSQDDVMVGPSIASRFFDPLWTDRPGGWVAGLGASAARAVAQQQGGSAVFLAGERRGTTIRLNFVPTV